MLLMLHTNRSDWSALNVTGRRFNQAPFPVLCSLYQTLSMALYQMINPKELGNVPPGVANEDTTESK